MINTEAHKRLIEQVSLIDPLAAEYIRTDARELSCFCESSRLSGVFTWGRTPQGQRFWREIHLKLVKLDKRKFRNFCNGVH